MRVIGYRHTGDIDVLEEGVLEAPVAEGRDILVAVKAVSVNPVDTKVRKNSSPTSDSVKVIGFDASGVVAAVGPECTLFNVGDEVYYAGAIDRAGSNAELQLVDERLAALKPTSLSFADAAAMPLTSITAWELLFERLAIGKGEGKGETLLVINGAGGVGSILIQLARTLTDLNIVATASRPETRDWALRMGAHSVVDHSQDLVAQVRSHGINMVDYVAGLTNTAGHMLEIAEVIRPYGRLSLIDDGSLDIGPLKPKSVTVAWEMMFTRPLFQTPDMQAHHEILSEIARLIDSKKIATTATKHFGAMSAVNIAKAHEFIQKGRTIGKVVLDGF